VFLLDKRTGRGVHTLSNAAEALEDHSSSLGEQLGTATGAKQCGSSRVCAASSSASFEMQFDFQIPMVFTAGFAGSGLLAVL
jgi:hypothetical protein